MMRLTEDYAQLPLPKSCFNQTLATTVLAPSEALANDTFMGRLLRFSRPNGPPLMSAFLASIDNRATRLLAAFGIKRRIRGGCGFGSRFWSMLAGC